jgi:cytochrome c biogenesis protein CcmG/thiol:disulfide interchange protein DsbE
MGRENKRSQNRTPIVIGMVLVVAVALGAIAMISVGGRSTSVIAVSAAPSVTESLRSSLEPYRGRVVILNIWATWCGPCRVEIPDFVKLQDKYRDQGLEIVGVSIDPIDPRGGGAAAVAPFMAQYKINYNVWLVNNPNAFAEYPMGQGIPTTYVLDRDGKIYRKYIGVRPMSVFENDIKALL